MSRPKPKLVAAGLSVVVGAALGAAALALGGASGRTHSTTVDAPPLRKRPPPTLAQNRQHLSPETTRQLSAWATRLADCLANHDLAIGQPRAADNDIVITPSTSLAKDPMTTLLPQMYSCTKALGGPPTGTSVVFEPQTEEISIYKPKTCLLKGAPQ